MVKNKELIEETIRLRELKDDSPQEIATRNKASPLDKWNAFKPFNQKNYNNIFKNNIDGLKLKFRYTTLTINARHKSK